MPNLITSSNVDSFMAAADYAAMASLLSAVVSSGPLGTPSSGTLTNCTGLPAAGVVGTAAVLGANTFTALQTMSAGMSLGSSVLANDSANIVAIRNSTNAQTLRIYGTASGTPGTDYVRASLSCSTTAVTLAAQTAGMHASDNIDIILTPVGTGKIKLQGVVTGPTATDWVFTNIASGTDMVFTSGSGTECFRVKNDGSMSLFHGVLSIAGNKKMGFVSGPYFQEESATAFQITNGTFGTYRDLYLRNLINTLTTPASASATGVAGTITADADFVYVCTATNTWKRVAIATW